jgi:hypothetical protein
MAGQVEIQAFGIASNVKSKAIREAVLGLPSSRTVPRPTLAIDQSLTAAVSFHPLDEFHHDQVGAALNERFVPLGNVSDISIDGGY